MEARFDRETTLVRLAHVKTVAPLQYALSRKQWEEETKKRRDVQFPQSAAEFMIQDKELQQRIVRFLTSDAIIQDKMLGEYGWEWRQVQGLKEAYSRDVSSI